MKRKLKASFTIEAAVIVPLIMVLVTALLIAAFALHDRAVMRSDLVYEVMDRSGAFSEESEQAAAALQESLSGKMIAAGDMEVSITEKSDSTELSANAANDIPGGLIGVVAGDSFRHLSARIQVSNLNGRKELIRYKTICDGLSALGTEKKEEKKTDDEH